MISQYNLKYLLKKKENKYSEKPETESFYCYVKSKYSRIQVPNEKKKKHKQTNE